MSVPEVMGTERPHRDMSTLTLVILGAALLTGILATMADTQTQQWIIVALIITVVFLFRRNEVTAGLLIVAEVLLDWSELVGAPLYWPLISLVCASILVVILFMAQSDDHPWISTPYLWMWALMLVWALYPAYHALERGSAIQYYLGVFVAPLLMYVIGVQVIRNREQLRTLLGVLTGFGALIGLHSFIITAFGVFFFEPDALQRFLITNSNFVLSNDSRIHRAASFLTNPDSNGAFLATLICAGVGLAWSAQSWSARALYIAECVAMAGGLICTFSIGSLLTVAPSIFVFILLAAGTLKRRLIALGAVLIAAVAVLAVKPSLLGDLLAHGTSSGSSSLRLGAWETGIHVILAHPLTGVGLSYASYISRAEPYRVALQYRVLGHPHNSFLELGALAGVPVMLLFMGLLAMGFRRVIHLWRVANPRGRALFSGVLCALLTLTLNSLTTPVWTLPPLAMMGWLLMGAACSPALAAVVEQLRPALALKPANSLVAGSIG